MHALALHAPRPFESAPQSTSSLRGVRLDVTVQKGERRLVVINIELQPPPRRSSSACAVLGWPQPREGGGGGGQL